MDYVLIGMALALLYFVLAVADFYTTVLVLSSGIGHEANPLMRALMSKYGMDVALWAQVLSWMVVGSLALIYPSEEMVVGLIIVLILKAVIVLNNALNAVKVWEHACKSQGVQGKRPIAGKAPGGGAGAGNELPLRPIWFG